MSFQFYSPWLVENLPWQRTTEIRKGNFYVGDEGRWASPFSKSRFVEANYFESLESPRGSSCEMAKPLLEKVTSLNKDNHKFA